MSTGSSLPMIDARDRVTAGMQFVIDIELPGMLYAKILRSPYPHARITRIDPAAALEMPGVVAVFTRQDVLSDPEIKPYHGPQIADQPLVALDVVRHVGDVVAAVAATDPDAAEEALFYIDVDYEELPSVFDPLDAMAADAVRVHDVGEELLGTAAYFGLNPLFGTNCPHVYSLRQGDLEKGFAEADHVIEGTFRVPSAAHVAMEPQASIAYFDDDGLTVYANTQTPFNVRDALAHMFSLPPEKVRVLVHTLGGAYGSKTFMHTEPIAVALARKTGRPVKVMLSRAETFVAVNRHPMQATIKLGVKKDGSITAKQVEAYFDTGAYADSGPGVAQKGGYASVGPYKIPNVAVDSHCVYTNLPRNGAYRGYGVTQIAFASEAIMDMAAQRIGMDPLEFRVKNLLHDGDLFATGQLMDDVQFEACLREAAAAVGWQDGIHEITANGKLRGKGLCVLLKGMLTPGISNALVEITSSGEAYLHTGTVELGQGARTVIAQIASEVLDMPYDAFEVILPDTQTTPFDSRTTSSRSTYMMGNAVRSAAQDLRRQILELGADNFNVEADRLILEDGCVLFPERGQTGLAYSELLRQTGHESLLGTGDHRNPGGLDPQTGKGVATSHWHQGAGAVEVEVDPETGKVEILRCHASVYAGRVINQTLAELQNQGNILFGLGSALFEEIVFDQGQVSNPNLSDYLIPSFMDMPARLTENLLEVPGAVSHGVGETALPTIPAAVANAVAHACGVRIFELPITPEKVLRAIRERGQAS